MLQNLTNYLCADANTEAPHWVQNSFPVIKIVLVCILLLCAIAMIVFVLMQKTESNGVSAISGKTDTFYNRNKKGTLQGKIKLLTIIDAICILVVCVAYLVLNTIFEGFI